MQSRAKKRRTPKNEIQRAMSMLMDCGLHGARLTTTPPEDEMMSQVLLDFVEPYLPLATNRKKAERLFALALAAWNAALLPAKTANLLINSVLGLAGPENEHDVRLLMNDLMTRKKQHFPDCNRFMLNFDVQRERDGFSVTVMATAGERRMAEAGFACPSQGEEVAAEPHRCSRGGPQGSAPGSRREDEPAAWYGYFAEGV